MIASPYREITRPVLDYVKRISKESPRTVVTVFIPEYVVGHWWEQVLHNQSALRLKGRLLFMPNVMVTSVPWQLNSSERLKTLDATRIDVLHYHSSVLPSGQIKTTGIAAIDAAIGHSARPAEGGSSRAVARLSTTRSAACSTGPSDASPEPAPAPPISSS